MHCRLEYLMNDVCDSGRPIVALYSGKHKNAYTKVPLSENAFKT